MLVYCCASKYDQCYSCSELENAESKSLLFCCHFLDEAEGVNPRQTEVWADRPPGVGVSGQGEPMRHYRKVYIFYIS